MSASSAIASIVCNLLVHDKCLCMNVDRRVHNGHFVLLSSRASAWRWPCCCPAGEHAACGLSGDRLQSELHYR